MVAKVVDEGVRREPPVVACDQLVRPGYVPVRRQAIPVTPVMMHLTHSVSFGRALQYEMNWAVKTPLLSVLLAEPRDPQEAGVEKESGEHAGNTVVLLSGVARDTAYPNVVQGLLLAGEGQ